ncbi:putative secreted protein [Brucella sp. 10RB9215]|uniref:hypothetical protein n=1 Tax=Brucella sp. 10RB9215 TaxID=1149953 RepID=UPI00090C4239|nr:hypothetical protein [Brucella sp. 10RB9215]SBW14303.1 putative secreted protein [Brucella sp. 10RB9215]
MTFLRFYCAGAAVLCVTSALAEEKFTCADYIRDTESAYLHGGELMSATNHGLNQVTMLAMGAFLARKGMRFSRATSADQTTAFVSMYRFCQRNPNELAVDAAIMAATPVTDNKQVTQDEPKRETKPEPKPHSITAAEILSGINRNKTELEQQAWWDKNMSGQIYELTGAVTEVEEGMLSGYWVDLDLGRNVLVRCGMSRQWSDIVTKLHKGDKFTCKGKVDRSWTSFYKTMFQVDAG